MKKTLTTIFIVLAILLIGNISNAASDFTLKSIDFDATLTEDGDMEVTETWKIKIHSLTNTLFKTFALDEKGYNGISNVKVSEVTRFGQETPFTEKNEEVLHVDTKCYYGLINSKGQYEIAWGINEEFGDKIYQISYKVEDIVKKYNDTSELYWQFIGKDFGVDIDKVTGTILVPNNSTDKTTTRAWAHGPLNGNIEIKSADKVKFEIEYLDSGKYLEVRLAMPREIFNIQQIEEDKLNKILAEENSYAKIANIMREEMESNKKEISKTVLLIIQTITTSLVILCMFKMVKYIEIIKTVPKIKPENKSKYYREIPNENATPAEAGFLYYFGKSGVENNLPKVLSGTIMNLTMKQYIEIEETNSWNKKEQLRIKVLEKSDNKLKEDEKQIYNLLKTIQGKQDGFNIKELEKYAKNNYEEFLGKLEEIPNIVKKQLEKQEQFDSETYKKGQNYIVKSILFGLLIIYSIIMIAITEKTTVNTMLIISSVITIVLCVLASTRYGGLTQKGENEKEAWHGLKRYMEDYSMIDDREVPELAVWEKYLVFATVFGIADKVLKQLKIQYPELKDNNTYIGTMYNTGLNVAMINSLNNSITNVYNTRSKPKSK